MKNKRSTRALRGLTGLTSSLLVVALGTTTIANAWASKINEYLGTTTFPFPVRPVTVMTPIITSQIMTTQQILSMPEMML